jgi:anthranilate synthase component 1
MLTPFSLDKSEFIRKAKEGNLIPVFRKLRADLETPVSAFLKIRGRDYAFLLESVEGGEKIGRYSFLGTDPHLVFSSRGRQIRITEKGKSRIFLTENDPLQEIKKILAGFRFVKTAGLPRFPGGLVGYLSYDIVRFFEAIPDKNPDTLRLPESCFMLMDTALVFDHVDHSIIVLANAFIPKGATKNKLGKIYQQTLNKINLLVRRLKTPLALQEKKSKARQAGFTVKSNFSEKRFCRMVARAKEYIRAGDIIQVVPSQRFQTRFACAEFDLYRSLRSVNPSPYMYYLQLGGFSLIGSSPELMVRCEDGKAELRPIAGTRPRGATEEADEKLMRNLLASPKEKAEHLMLVDLGRNDLGRVCRFGSVKISDWMVIEKYSHVMHIVSAIKGRLKTGKDVFDLIRATFPAGTVSGAPKIRAMEIIDELEPVRRGPYAGLIGYFSFSGNFDSCITIRTIVTKGKTAYVQAGGGVVSDSRPKKEYQETVNKAKALLKAIQEAQGY